MTSDAFSESIKELAWLWLGLTLPPLSWAGQMATMYALQPWLCLHGGTHVPNDLISLIAALVSIVGGALAWRRLRELSGLTASATQQCLSRARFMASLGIAQSAIFVLVILAQWLPNRLLSPCPL